MEHSWTGKGGPEMLDKKYYDIFVDLSKGRAQHWSDPHHCNMAIYWALTAGRHSTKCTACGRHRSEMGWNNDLSFHSLAENTRNMLRLFCTSYMHLMSRPAHSQGLQNKLRGIRKAFYKPREWQKELLMPEGPSLCAGGDISSVTTEWDLGSHIFIGEFAVLFLSLCRSFSI